MTTLTFDANERVQFLRFLVHRRLNDAAIELLRNAKESNDLKATDLKTAKTSTYEEITENLIKAVNRGWITLEEVVRLLDRSEFAGRQHICVFMLPVEGRHAILRQIRNPVNLAEDSPTIGDYLTVPTASTARIVSDSKDTLAVKIVTKRSYWLTQPLEEYEDRVLIERIRKKERAAVIIKCDLSTGLVQCRVPPREKGPQETASAVFEFLTQALEDHFNLNAQSWFTKLLHFPIGDAFPKILRNTTDFILWYDSPQDEDTSMRISKRGRPDNAADLRESKNWQFSKGYSRDSIRGFWKCPSQSSVYSHMNLDRVKVNSSTSRNVARLVVADLCSDEDLDYVVKRIHEHI